MKMSVNIAGIEWKNPVAAAAGIVASGKEYSPYLDFNAMGAITSKGVSNDMWLGNPVPRITESYGGIVSSIGVQNNGVAAFIKDDAPFFNRLSTVGIVNVCGQTIYDYVKVAEALNDINGVSMLELNLAYSDDFTTDVNFSNCPKRTEQVVKAVKKATNLPVITKLTPNVTDITEIAKAAEAAGSDALSMIQGLSALKINIRTKKPSLGNTYGTLTGPAIKPVAVRCVYQVAKATKLPIIGMGGITTGDDAIEFLLAGASAVAVGSAIFSNPKAPLLVLEGIKDYMQRNNIQDVNEITGKSIA